MDSLLERADFIMSRIHSGSFAWVMAQAWRKDYADTLIREKSIIGIYKTTPKSSERELEYYREYRRKNKDKIKAYFKESRRKPENAEKNKLRNRLAKEKRNANAAVRSRVQRGTLKRGCCVFCNEPNAMAHHEDYSKKYEIVWACSRHHADIHSNRIKVSPEQITIIDKDDRRWKKNR